MVDAQLVGRGVRDERVLAAMAVVPREAFLPPGLNQAAYDDTPLPIAKGQTMSQPYIVALMAEALALRGHEKVLEVGTGSGYAAAVLGKLAADVYTVERHEELARGAGERLAALGYTNVHVVVGDGTRGLPERAPFDAITVAAAGRALPEALLDQLAVGGRLVIPVGDPSEQRLVRLLRTTQGFERTDLGSVRFVPLVTDTP